MGFFDKLGSMAQSAVDKSKELAEITKLNLSISNSENKIKEIKSEIGNYVFSNNLLREDDLLIITADHGNDPTYKGTDHTREKVPFIAYSKSFKGFGELEETDTYATIGATVVDNFGLKMPEGTIGKSVLDKLK